LYAFWEKIHGFYRRSCVVGYMYDSAKLSALNFPIDGAANTFHDSSMFDY